MTNHTQLDENLGETDNVRVWKYRTSMILEEIGLNQYFNKEGLGDRGR